MTLRQMAFNVPIKHGGVGEIVISTVSEDLTLNPADASVIQYIITSGGGLRPGYASRLRDLSANGSFRDPLTAAAVSFNGVDSYAACGAGVHPLAGTAGCTMLAWVYLNSLGSYPMIVSGSDGAGTNRVEFCFSAGTGRLALYVMNGSLVVHAGDAIAVDEWHAVAVTAQQSVAQPADVNVELFIDGVSVKSGTIASQTLATSWADTCWLGAREISSTYNYPLDGRLQDVVLFNRVLSDQDIAKYASTTTFPMWGTGSSDIKTESIGAHWALEERFGLTGYDQSGNGYHLTLTSGCGRPTSGNAPRAYANDVGYEESDIALPAGKNWILDNSGGYVLDNNLLPIYGL